MKKISVIIPSYNSFETVGATISALQHQSKGGNICEILVVDSSDDEKTRPFIKGLKAQKLRLIEAGAKIMPAVVRNIGADLAQGEILVFIDSDAYMAPDWIEKVLEHVDAGRKMGGGAILLPPSQRSKWIPTAQYFLQFNEYMDVGGAREKPFLPSCNMFCDREVFFRVGGFPELRASEDVMFFLKAGALGKIWFIPEAKVFHIFRESLTAMIRNQRLLGRYVLIYRRVSEKAMFYYHGFWPFIFLPAFMLIKFFRILKRVLESGRHISFQLLRVSPAFFLGFLFWGVGFAEGILTADLKAVKGAEA